MPGGRPWGFRLGDSAELLAEIVLSAIAFTTPVPRQEDVGHDFLCTLILERAGNLITAGPFFTVQVKKNHEHIIYEKQHEVAWIRDQDNPFFICVADRDNLQVELYSTWNMLNGFLHKAAARIILAPGGPDDNLWVHSAIETYEREAEIEQVIPLGKPVLRMTVQDIMDEDRARDFGTILRQWVELDRENIVNRRAGMYWVVGPTFYETNEPLSQSDHGFSIAFYWNPKNLPVCQRNFGRAATALRVVMRRVLGPEGEAMPGMIDRINALDQVLESYSDCLDPLAKSMLRDQFNLIHE